MTRPAAVAALLTLALASPARAFTISGEVGLAGARSDGWSSDVHTGNWHLDWFAQLSLGGSPFRPGLLDWGLTAVYRGLRNYYSDSSNRTDGIGGQARLSLFQGMPVSLSLFGGRDWIFFASSTDNERTGLTTTTNAGATALFNLSRFPSVRASFNWVQLDNRALGGQRAQMDSLVLSVGAAHNIGGLSYSVGYDTSWNFGTFAEVNYRSHSVNLQLSAPLSNTSLFRLVGRYYLRLPTGDAPTNPRFDDGLIGAGVQWRPDRRTTASFDYNFRHFVIESRGTPTLEQTSHGLTHFTSRRVTDELTVNGSAAVTYLDERSDELALRAAAQTLGLGLAWHRRRRSLLFGIGLGGQGGLVERIGSGLSLAGGVNGSLGLTWSRPLMNLTASYSGGISSGVGGQPGWTLHQQLQLGAEGLVRSTVALRALLTLVGQRREDPILGSFAAGNATLTLEATTARHRARLTAGVTEGTSNALRDELVGDGLFLPVGFNSYAVYGMITASQSLDRGRLTFTENARALWNRAPGRTDQYEYGVWLTASYTIGAFVFALEERFSVGGLVGTQQIGNLVMLRVSRAFGWRF